MNTALRIKGLKISKMIAMVMAMVLIISYLGVIAHATVIIKPDAISDGPIGGQYAYGHTGYSTSIASAYTKHEVVGYKHVEVYGIYRKANSNIYKRTQPAASAVSTSTANAYTYASLPADGEYFVGSHANHQVAYGATYWSDYTAVGEQYYSN